MLRCRVTRAAQLWSGEPSNAWSRDAASVGAGSSSTSLSRRRSPDTNLTSAVRKPNAPARARRTASFALPSTAGAATATSNAGPGSAVPPAAHRDAASPWLYPYREPEGLLAHESHDPLRCSVMFGHPFDVWPSLHAARRPLLPGGPCCPAVPAARRCLLPGGACCPAVPAARRCLLPCAGLAQLGLAAPALVAYGLPEDRGGFATLTDVLGAVAQSGSAPRSHRGGQGFKSPQLHPGQEPFSNT